MGKRKSRSVKVMKKAPPKVDKVFDCPFCSHSGTVEVKMERPLKIAHLSCRICATGYQMNINKLSKEVDVYCSWIDEAEAKNKNFRQGGGAPTGLGFTGNQNAGGRRRENLEDSDGDEEDSDPNNNKLFDDSDDDNRIQTKSRVMPTQNRLQVLKSSNRHIDEEENKSEDDEDDYDSNRRAKAVSGQIRSSAPAQQYNDDSEDDLF